MKYVCFVVSFGTAEHVPNNTVQFKISCLNSGPKIFLDLNLPLFFKQKYSLAPFFVCASLSVCVCMLKTILFSVTKPHLVNAIIKSTILN